jgi:glycolate oxidase
MTATAPMIGELAREIEAVVGPQGLISRPEQLRVYESDGLTVFRQAPALVVLPVTTEEVRDVVRLCRRYGVPFVPRGSGTGLSGGALPVEGCVVIGLSKMQRIHEVDLANQRIVVEPGVLNLWVTQKVAPHGYYYAPDPSSQQVCSIGGNVAENSGGAHCLKYGFTVNHVLGMEIVTPDGDVVEIGGAAVEAPGYDLPGIFVGSEGMLGICTKITLRLVRRAESIRLSLVAFDSTDAAGEAVSGIIGAGIVPSAIEMMDNLAIRRPRRRPTPATRSTRARCCSSSSTVARSRWTSSRGRSRRSAGRRVPWRSGSRATPKSGPCSGRGARRRSRRWDASARTISCRMA